MVPIFIQEEISKLNNLKINYIFIDGVRTNSYPKHCCLFLWVEEDLWVDLWVEMAKYPES